MFQADSDVVGNALIGQKDTILAAINKAEDREAFEAAYQQLALVADLWRALGYSYKLMEMRNRIYSRLDACRTAAQETRDTCRKNTSRWRSWEAEITSLDNTCNKVCLLWVQGDPAMSA